MQGATAVEKKMLIFVLLIVQQLEDAVKPGQLVEFRLRCCFQIAKHAMFSMTRTVDLIVFVLWIFADQFDRAIGRLVSPWRRFGRRRRFLSSRYRIGRRRFL